MDPALITKKGLLLNHFCFLLKMGMVILVFKISNKTIALGLVLGLQICCFLAYYCCNSFRAVIQRIQIAVSLCFTSATAFLLIITLVTSLKAKTVLSVFVIIFLILIGVLVIGISIRERLAVPVEIDAQVGAIEVDGRGMTIDKYWNLVA